MKRKRESQSTGQLACETRAKSRRLRSDGPATRVMKKKKDEVVSQPDVRKLYYHTSSKKKKVRSTKLSMFMCSF
jgi:hypothetical protein